MDGNQDKPFRKVHQCTCSKCKKEMEELYQIDAFWNLPISIRSTYNWPEKQTLKQYNLLNTQREQYFLCDKCVNKRFMQRYLLIGFLVIISIMFIIAQSIGGESADIGGMAMVFIIIAAIAIIRQVHLSKSESEKEKWIRKTLDRFASERLTNDLFDKQRNTRFTNQVPYSNAFVWTEYSKKTLEQTLKDNGG